MGLFSILLRPYTQAIRAVTKTGERIKKDIDDVSESIDKSKDKENLRYMEAENSKEAFEMLFVENKWTEEELVQQAIFLRRSRFIMLGFSWVSLMVALFFFIKYAGSSWFLSILFPAFFAFVFVSFLLAALRYSIYHEQVTKRDLITLKEYMKQGEFIRKIFG